MSKKFLLMRFGGMGDNLFMTPVARELHRRGYKVDVATRHEHVPLWQGNPHVNRIIPLYRFGAVGQMGGRPVNLFNDGDCWLPDVALYDRYPSDRPARNCNVADYFRVIESHSLHPSIAATMGSDWLNTYDVHLAWAGIDPASVCDEGKRPVYRVKPKERKWAEKVTKDWGEFVLIQTYASSPARSYTNPDKLAKLTENPVIWRGNHWDVGGTPLPWPDFPPIRATAALVERAKFVVSTDTAISHLAEALKTRHVTGYSTVPSATRSGYYQYERTVEHGIEDEEGFPCKCCVIARDCPRRAKDAYDSLSQKERELLGLLPPQALKQLGVAGMVKRTQVENPVEHFAAASDAGLKMMIDAAATKLEAQRQMQAYCIADLDFEGAIKAELEGE